jgi:hypothetical protein
MVLNGRRDRKVTLGMGCHGQDTNVGILWMIGFVFILVVEVAVMVTVDKNMGGGGRRHDFRLCVHCHVGWLGHRRG